MIGLIVSACVVWAGLVLTAPVLPAPLAALVYAIGSAICHQRPERSFHLDGVQLPVCARCAGIYAGAVFGAVGACWSVSMARRRAARGMAGQPSIEVRTRARWMRRLVLVAMLPTVVTVAAEWTRVWLPSNHVRAAAGAIVGAAVAMALLATLHYERCPSRRPASPGPLQPRI